MDNLENTITMIIEDAVDGVDLYNVALEVDTNFVNALAEDILAAVELHYKPVCSIEDDGECLACQ